MKEFFTNMDTMQQIYWGIALTATLVFVVQTIMTFVGSDADTGMDADFDGDLEGGDFPFKLFSLRNLVNFFLGVGWTGVVLYGHFENPVWVGVIAFLVGLVFIGIFFLVARFMMRLAEDNSFKIEDTVGKTADVYLTIPAKNEGKGRVQVSVKGAIHELDAITNSSESLKGGSVVKVTAVKGNVLVVENVF